MTRHRSGGSAAGWAWRAICGAACLLAAPPAAAETLRGTLVDALDGNPIAGRVRLSPGDVEREAGADGVFVFEVGPGTYRLWARGTDGAEARSGELRVEAGGTRTTRLHLATSRVPTGPWPEGAYGVPLHRRPAHTTVAPTPARWGVAKAGFPPPLPATIRVGRRFATTCAGHDVVEIQTIDFEDYVRGVVAAEVGVFQNIAWERPGRAADECFKTFAVAARSYALWFVLTRADQPYDIDDTACNQRYEDDRLASVDPNVDATRGMVLVDLPGTAPPFNVEKYEYAASCGRNTTLPEHAASAVPDQVGPPWGDPRACVGTWCGHDGCAAHEGCLVRGICQWGSMERALRGDDFRAMLAHYQPHLALYPDSAVDPTGELVGFVRAGDVFAGPPIPGAAVRLDTGETTLTDDTGYYALAAVPAGSRTLTATAAGFEPGTLVKEVEAGLRNWGSIALHPTGDPDAGDGGTDAPADVPDDADADPEDGSPDADASADAAADSGGGGWRDAGCGCRTAPVGSGAPLLALAALLASLLRRRARRPPPA